MTIFTKDELKAIIEKYENHKFKDEIKYYVHELSEQTGLMGFFTDKFYVGLHNKHTHFKIDNIKKSYQIMIDIDNGN